MIEIRNVSKCFGETQAVSRVSLTLREANVFGMLGTNGAGKSTLLRMMAGILRPDEGEILIDGENVWDNPEAKRKIFYISDDQFFSEKRVIEEDVRLFKLLRVVFAVIIGKEVFGGTGMNIVNPALLARAFLFFSYPSKMSGDDIWIADKPDAYSGATPLGELLNGNNVIESLNISDMFFGFMPGSVGETSKLAILTGGMFLILTQVISLRILLSVFAGAIIMSLTFNLIGSTPAMEVTFWQHFLIGGFLFGAFFMATDPVTAAQTNTGKIIYGFFVGAIAIMIRVINQAYPEGMMLSILLMNFFAPFIDYVVVNNNIRKRKRRLAKTERRSP